MRRLLPAALQTLPSKECATTSRNAVSDLSIRLELECVTPVIGGGVESYVPDPVDYVRVPGIRGRLREFWRAIEPAPMNSSADDLFRREVSIWGGVGADGDGSSRTSRSRVEISVDVPRNNRGREDPAGWHEPRPNGGFSALPKWRNRNLGYGCFPLQQPREALDKVAGTTLRVGTHNVREGLRFQLRLRVAPATNGNWDDADTRIREANRVLGSLFCWIYLGGLGGRTTRGFGALRLRGEASIQGIEGMEFNKWMGLFKGPQNAESAVQWLRDGLALAGMGGDTASSEIEWFTLRGAKIYAGPPQATTDAAHGMLLSALQIFRQGQGVGRNVGRGTGRPGSSRWPEANLLKRKWDFKKTNPEWEHPPPMPYTGQDGAPRAAFGLPIVISFKDRTDSFANASLEAAGNSGGRWRSPVWLRPVRCADGRWVPLVVALAKRPSDVEIVFRNPPPKATPNHPKVLVRSTNSGAKPPIAGYLDRNGGDAVDAFLDWLVAEHHFVDSRGVR